MTARGRADAGLRPAMREGRPPTVAAALEAGPNALALTRLVLALAVVVSHAFSVTTGSVNDEPLHASTGFTLGEHAVNGFFAISGFLVTMSFTQRGWRDYAISRALRIGPGLVAATVAVGFLLGPILSRLSPGAYLLDGRLWTFLVATLTALKSNTALPGVFETNPFRFPIGTIWTLRYEVLCYAGVFAAGVTGLLGGRWPAVWLAVGLGVAIVGLDLLAPGAGKGPETALRLPFLFATGAAFHVWRDKLRLSVLVGLGMVGAAALLHATPVFKASLFLAEAYGVLAVALSPALARPGLDLRADLSYGTYLYGWPIQQAFVQLAPGISAPALLVPSIVLTLGVAALSWFAVEKPSLALKARTLGRGMLRTIEPAGP